MSWRFDRSEVQFSAPEAGRRAALRGYPSRPESMRGPPEAAKQTDWLHVASCCVMFLSCSCMSMAFRHDRHDCQYAAQR